MSMNSDRRAPLEKDIVSAEARARELTARITSSKFGNDKLILEAVEELRTTVEELHVVDEELRQQNDELMATREDAENERRKYEDLFECAPDAYLVTDKHGSIVKANRAASRLLGLSQKFLEGKPLINYVDRSDRAAFAFDVADFDRSRDIVTKELDVQVSPRVANTFHASFRISTVRDREGKLGQLLWLMRDVTELKESAREISKLNAELEERVRRRTAELEQANLLKDELLTREHDARQEAEAANQSKDEFLAIVSHELRTPLNAILGWAQLLNQEAATPEQQAHAAQVIERSARAQTRLIDDILDVSRIISGGLPLEKRPVNMAQLIESALESNSPSIGNKDIALNVEVDAADAVVLGDPARLQQVISNILSNATKFSKSGGRISVRLTRDKDFVQVSITDRGIGISEEFLPYVFDRFRQADSRFSRQHGGLGLGLAIVKILVELHGGEVRAESGGLEHGSTFTVILPAIKELVSALEPVNTVNKREKITGPNQSLASVRVLVVDDDRDAQEMMRIVLEGYGARVVTCGSYEETLALIEKSRKAGKLPDVLVADIAMPGRDGFDLIKAIRSLDPQYGGAIPAIALTAYADLDTRNRVLDEGYQQHVTKPLNLEELVSAIGQLCEKDD